MGHTGHNSKESVWYVKPIYSVIHVPSMVAKIPQLLTERWLTDLFAILVQASLIFPTARVV
jgi:hypothetical protein